VGSLIDCPLYILYPHHIKLYIYIHEQGDVGSGREGELKLAGLADTAE
jgi:hypothetical protein